MDVHSSVGGPYDVKGFPTIKVTFSCFNLLQIFWKSRLIKSRIRLGCQGIYLFFMNFQPEGG